MPLILQRIVGALLGVVALVAAFTFALAAMIAIAVIGLGVWGWLRWKTRGRATAPGPVASGRVIDGEAVVVEDVAPRLDAPDAPERRSP
jgi:hypothetical protein